LPYPEMTSQGSTLCATLWPMLFSALRLPVFKVA